MAMALGADLPVCLAGRASYLGGIGERIEPVPMLPRVPVVLVNPLQPLATPAVFKARSGPFSSPARLGAIPGDVAGLARELARRRNDLEAPAIALLPALRDILDRLAVLPGCLLARMSGSGATCFAVFERAGDAALAAAALRQTQPGWWVCDTELIGETAALVPERG